MSDWCYRPRDSAAPTDALKRIVRSQQGAEQYRQASREPYDPQWLTLACDQACKAQRLPV